MADMTQNKDELVAEAANLGLDTEGNKQELVDRINAFELGVPVEDVKDAVPDPVKTEPEELDVLVRYTGQNPTFGLGSFVFTPSKPFVVIPKRLAKFAFTTYPDKFREANFVEAQEYYS